MILFSTVVAFLWLTGVAGGPLKTSGKPCPQGDGLYAIGCSSKYIQCVNGIEFKQNCPSGLFFDRVLARCERRTKVNSCSSSSKSSNIKQKAVEINCKNKTPGDYALETNTCNENYYQCANDISYMRKCPYNQEFSDSIKRCDYAENCKKTLSGHLKEDAGAAYPNFEGTLPPGVTTEEVDQIENQIDCKLLQNATISKNNCSPFFFQCAQDKLLKKHCPSGLVYNVEQNLCDYPESCQVRSSRSSSTTIAPISNDVVSSTTISTTTTTTTSSAPIAVVDVPIVFECREKDDGFYEIEHCGTRFASCLNGTVNYITCGDQLLYDPRINACDYPEACRSERIQEDVPNVLNHGSVQHQPINLPAPVFDCSTKADGQYSVSPCTSTYIQCSGGNTFTQTCPSDLVYNSVTETCDNLESCSTSSTTTTTEEPTTTVLDTTTTTETPVETTEDELEIPSTVATTTSAPLIDSDTPIQFSCANLENGNYASGECQSKFYQCWNNQVSQTECPSNLVFNPYQGQCDYKSQQIGCNVADDDAVSKITTTTSSPVSIPTTTSVESTTEQTTTTTTTVEVTSPATTISTTSTTTAAPIVQTGTVEPFCERLADGTYASGCSQFFYKCVEFATTKLQCPSELHYNIDTGLCDYFENIVACNRSSSTTTIAPSTTTKVPAIAFTCIGRVDGIYALPYCSRNFVQCVNGNSMVESCTEGLFYSEKTGLCDYHQNVETCHVKTVDFTNTLCSGKSDGYYSNGCSEHYYSCVTEKVRKHECPTHLKFSHEKQFCDYPQDIEECTLAVVPLVSPPIIDVNFCVSRPSIIHAFAKCSPHYIVCDNGIATGGTCASPLVFNEVTGLCDYRSNYPDCDSQ